MTIVVKRVDVELTKPIRAQILRPGLPLSHSSYPGEENPRSGAFAAFEGDAILGVSSVMPEQCPWNPNIGDAWRLRGMAVLPQARNRGVGARLLEAALTHVRAEAGKFIWCNARVPALSLYLRAGFTIEGEEFELPHIGPHRQMWLAL
ncbi:MAG: GNAT family N-acetyltransferase [Corynebacteriales bacterium]|nr:GNAT family N-acetyltransferase [Mycobacteriales bacterium]